MEIDVNRSKHIMISYSHKYENDVKHIYTLLEEEFKEVPKWIDYEKMSGNIIKSMTDAVNNSFLIIVFMSKSYKNSKNCRLESDLLIKKNIEYILVLNEEGFPYLENNEKSNWVSKYYNNDYYIDFSNGIAQDRLEKLYDIVREKIINYYDEIPSLNLPKVVKRRSNSFNITKKLPSTFRKSRSSPIKRFSPLFTNREKQEEFDNFILDNDLDDNDVDKIKELIKKTPRTMIPTLKAEGMSFKGILEILNDIKKEE